MLKFPTYESFIFIPCQVITYVCILVYGIKQQKNNWKLSSPVMGERMSWKKNYFSHWLY